MSKQYEQKFRPAWLKDPLLKQWLTTAESTSGIVAKCKFCGSRLTSRYADLKNHANSKKHLHKLPVHLRDLVLSQKQNKIVNSYLALASLMGSTADDIVDAIKKTLNTYNLNLKCAISPSYLECFKKFNF
jgi:hypothetical protein